MHTRPLSFTTGRQAALMTLLVLLSILPLVAQAQQSEQSHDRQSSEPTHRVEVVIDGEALFSVRGVSAFPAERRAAQIRERIIEVAQNPEIGPDDLVVVDYDDRTEITAAGETLLYVFDIDAELEGVDRHLLAQVYRERIVEVMAVYRADRSTGSLLNNSAYAAGATVVFIFLLWIARKLFNWLVGWAERDVRKGVRELASKSHYILHAGQIWSIVAGLLRSLRFLSYLLLTYFYLNTVLGLYPWTRPLARTLLHLVVDPLRALGAGFLAQLPNLMFLLVLWFVVRYVLKLLKAFFLAVARGRIQLENFEDEWAMPTFKIVRIVIIAFSIVIAYPYIPGSDSLAFKGVSVFLGVLLSLGSSSFIANTIAGLTMTYRGTFRVGDRIRVGETAGMVEDVKLMITRVRTPKNESVIIPNSNILNTDVVNYTQLAKTEGLLLHTTVGIGYDVPWRQVEAMLIEAARRTPGLDAEREPFVLQTSLGDYAVNYELNVYCDDPGHMLQRYSDLHANIQDVFNENSVQIMSPAYIADPEEAKLVPKERWYAAPASKPEGAG